MEYGELGDELLLHGPVFGVGGAAGEPVEQAFESAEEPEGVEECYNGDADSGAAGMGMRIKI